MTLFPVPRLAADALSALNDRTSRFGLVLTPAQAAAELPTLARLPGIKWRISPTFTLPEGAGERCFVEGTTRSGA